MGYFQDLKGFGGDGSQTYAAVELPVVTIGIVLAVGTLLGFLCLCCLGQCMVENKEPYRKSMKFTLGMLVAL